MQDLMQYLGVVVRGSHRVQRDGQEARVVSAARTYPTGIDDLWDALTSIERIPRWFMPIEGDLRLGGTYQLKGNAGGTITECQKPKRLAVTWMFGENTSWVTVELEARGPNETHLLLEHTGHVPAEFWDTYGPGATGVGWDLGLWGLAIHIATGASTPPEGNQAWMLSPEGKALTRKLSDAWGQAAIADGADKDWALKAAESTRKFYSGES